MTFVAFVFVVRTRRGVQFTRLTVPTMLLSGRLCNVRPWRSSDLDALVRHANNHNIARQLRDRFPHPYTRAHGVAFLKTVTSQERPTSLAIEVDDEAAGGIGFVCGSDVERFSAEIGYWLSEQHWGSGIATEALELVSQYAYTTFNVLRLFALPFADNLGSIRVLEKTGYVREGLMRRSSVKYGQPRDQLLYARINPDWSI